MLDIFKKLYSPDDKIRHVIWVGPNKILIEKTVSTRDVDEFILKEPNQVDFSLVKAFGVAYEKINVFFVNSIDIDNSDEY